MKRSFLFASSLLALTLLAGCGEPNATNEAAEPKAAAAADDYERGPHRGRMLRDGDFAVEITIFEDGVEPEYRLYPYRDGKPLSPSEVRLTLEQKRLALVEEEAQLRNWARRMGRLGGDGSSVLRSISVPGTWMRTGTLSKEEEGSQREELLGLSEVLLQNLLELDAALVLPKHSGSV